MKIKILGTGCPSCKKLFENAELAIKEKNDSKIEIEYIQDIDKIISYGIMSLPAIIIDDEVKAIGKVSRVEEIKEWIK